MVQQSAIIYDCLQVLNVSSKGFAGVRVLRAFRVLRLFKVFKYIKVCKLSTWCKIAVLATAETTASFATVFLTTCAAMHCSHGV